jgi:hypothetical protein
MHERLTREWWLLYRIPTRGKACVRAEYFFRIGA